MSSTEIWSTTEIGKLVLCASKAYLVFAGRSSVVGGKIRYSRTFSCHCFKTIGDDLFVATVANRDSLEVCKIFYKVSFDDN